MRYLCAFFILYLLPVPVFSTDICPLKVVDGYDITDVQRRFDRIRKDTPILTVTHTHFERAGNETYAYTITLCGDFENSYAIKQVDLSKKEKIVKIVGRHTHYSLLLGGENWLFVQYFNGDNYTKARHCHGKPRQGWLSIRCEDQGEKPTLRVIEEAYYENQDKDENTLCYYFFEYNHKLACSPEILKKLEAQHKLSGGAIFFIVMVSLTSAYFLFGFLILRFVRGAKGLDQFPNYSFWRKLGNFSADGCDFVCRREEHPNTYKGMADALDIDSSEDEDRDDGLLPM